MLITKIIGDCPGCGGKATFGNVSVLGQEVLQGCGRCKYRSMLPLPPVQKKVIYLDQFFFSSAFRGKDARFVEAAERIKRACDFQLLAAPYSSVHEDETHQWRGRDGVTHEELMEFIKASSRGMRFEPAYRIERTQIVSAFSAFLAAGSLTASLSRKHAIRGELDQWDSYFRIDIGNYLADVDLKRRLKNESVDRLMTVLDHWQNSPETFEEHVSLELRDSGKGFMRDYLEMARRVAGGDFMAMADSPISAMVVEDMLQILPQTVQGEARLLRCMEFFHSEYFASVPAEWLSAHLFATVREMVKRGSFANRDKARDKLNGIFGDVSHISTYAPYCDAFVMDTPMAEIVRQPSVALEEKYGVKVFSLRNWDELFEWLDGLEAGMTAEHRTTHSAVYG